MSVIAGTGRCWRAVGQVLVLAVATAMATPADADPSSRPGLSEPERLRMMQRWVDNVVARQFELPEAQVLDADVHRHALALRQKAQEVLEDLGSTWSAAVPGQPDPDEAAMQVRLMFGSLAALARLQLGRHDPERASAWLPSLAAPRLCNHPRSVPSWSWHLQMLQRLPPTEREAAFAADLRGLAAMADASWQPPPRPSPSLIEQLPGWLVEQRAGRDDGRSLGMAPILGNVLFDRGEPDLSVWGHRCLIAQWWAREQVQRGRLDAAAAMLLFRYATLLQPHDWLNKPQGRADGYPELAQQFGVEADITVEWRRDALGRTTGHRVVKRQLTLPDATAGAWLPWEDHFDRHALAAARARPVVRPDAGVDPQAAKRERASFSFKLQ